MSTSTRTALLVALAGASFGQITHTDVQTFESGTIDGHWTVSVGQYPGVVVDSQFAWLDATIEALQFDLCNWADEPLLPQVDGSYALAFDGIVTSYPGWGYFSPAFNDANPGWGDVAPGTCETVNGYLVDVDLPDGVAVNSTSLEGDGTVTCTLEFAWTAGDYEQSPPSLRAWDSQDSWHTWDIPYENNFSYTLTTEFDPTNIGTEECGAHNWADLYLGGSAEADKPLYISVDKLPAGEFGYALFGDQLVLNGNLCVGGNIVRVTEILAPIPVSGQVTADIIPADYGIASGNTYVFQYWHRSPTSPSGSALSNAVVLTFQ